MSTDFIQTIFEMDHSEAPIFMVFIKLENGNGKIIRIQGTEDDIYAFFRPKRTISIQKKEEVVKYINIIGEVKKLKNEEKVNRLPRKYRGKSEDPSHKKRIDTSKVHHINID